MYIYVCMYIYICVCVCIYIYNNILTQNCTVNQFRAVADAFRPLRTHQRY